MTWNLHSRLLTEKKLDGSMEIRYFISNGFIPAYVSKKLFMCLEKGMYRPGKLDSDAADTGGNLFRTRFPQF